MINILSHDEVEQIRLAIEGEMQNLLGNGCRVFCRTRNGRLVFALGGRIPVKNVTQAIPGIFAYTINRYCYVTRNSSGQKTNQRNLPTRSDRHDRTSGI